MALNVVLVRRESETPTRLKVSLFSTSGAELAEVRGAANILPF